MSESPFSYRHRLHYRREYLKFFQKNEVFRLRECIIFRIPNNEGHFRLGVTLKSKGTSVERNRVKRQIRETFRKHGELLGSFDYNVVVPNSKKLGFPYPLRLRICLEKEFLSALQRRMGD